MRHALSVVVVVILASSAAAAPKRKAVADPDVAQANQFALALLSQAKGDVALSPWTARTALAVVALGAGGATAKELDAALGLSPDRAAVAAALARSTRALQEVESIRGNAMVGLFVRSASVLIPEYRALADQTGAKVEAVDFPDDKGVINAWVSKATAGQIRALLAPGDTRPDTCLVAVAAFALKAKWDRPFDAAATRSMDFRSPGQPARKVPMMQAVLSGRLKFTPSFVSVALPFADPRLEVVLVVPRTDDGLSQVEAAATPAALFEGLAPEQVSLFLPAFEQTSLLSLRAPLEALGVRDAFTRAADFSKLSGTELQVDKVLQQTKVSFDEEGVTAASATGVMAFPKAMVKLPATVSADHPFLYFVREVPSGRILVAGRVVTPHSTHAAVPEGGAVPPIGEAPNPVQRIPF